MSRDSADGPSTMRLHEGEPAIDAGLVRRLLAGQFPQWAGLPITLFKSSGTTNVIYRLGSQLAVRLPRVDYGAEDLAKESVWLRRLGPELPVEVPTPLAVGEPSEGYPWPWAVYRWIEGEVAAPARMGDARQVASELGQFINTLRRLDASGGPLATADEMRGAALRTRDQRVRAAITSLEDSIDVAGTTARWEAALEAETWTKPPTWFHGDLAPANLLLRDGRLGAVIDFGCLGTGDPACDLMVGWSLFAGASREAFREALGCDDAMWARGRGHALSQPLIYIPYYRHTNPAGVAEAYRLLAEVLAEPV